MKLNYEPITSAVNNDLTCMVPVCSSGWAPMEQLTEALSASFAVSRQPNSTAAPHPRLAQYKSKYSALEQSERRRRFLQLQKRCV